MKVKSPKKVPNAIERMYLGLNILFQHKDDIDFTDTDAHVIHKTAMLTSAPEHSNSLYIAMATVDECAEHGAILAIEGWQYEYPYYCFYML